MYKQEKFERTCAKLKGIPAEWAGRQVVGDFHFYAVSCGLNC